MQISLTRAPSLREPKIVVPALVTRHPSDPLPALAPSRPRVAHRPGQCAHGVAVAPAAPRPGLALGVSAPPAGPAHVSGLAQALAGQGVARGGAGAVVAAFAS